MQPANNSVFNALPPAVVALAVVIGGLEIMFQLAAEGIIGGQDGIGWRISAIENYTIVDSVVEWMLANGVYPADQLARFVTYPLIHGSFVHAAFVVVFVLALGKMVGEAFGQVAFFAVFWISAIVAGIVYVSFLNTRVPLLGGYPGAYGLIGAFTYMRWLMARMTGEGQHQAFSLIAMLAAIQIIFAVIYRDYGNLLADLTGFTVGFLVSFIVSPGGWTRLLAKLRQR